MFQENQDVPGCHASKKQEPIRREGEDSVFALEFKVEKEASATFRCSWEEVANACSRLSSGLNVVLSPRESLVSASDRESVRNARRIPLDLDEDEFLSKTNSILAISENRYEIFGRNDLFAVFGAISLQDGEETRNVPLLLMPVRTIKRRDREIEIWSTQERAEVNPVLSEFLRSRLFLKIPSLKEGGNLIDFLYEIEFLLMNAAEISVVREAYLAVLDMGEASVFLDSLPRLYRDVWEERKRAKTSLLDHSVEAERIATWTSPMIQVLEADVEQRCAIAAAVSGCDVAVDGGPGTGKSQTAANIAANLLAAGKTVLFVTDRRKIAEEFISNMWRAGLSDFCLDAFSEKRENDSFRRSLERRLSTPRPRYVRAELDDKMESFARSYEKLRTFASAATSVRQPSGRILPSLIWQQLEAEELADGLPENLTDVFLESATNLDRSQMSQLRDSFIAFERSWSQYVLPYGGISRHPWAGLVSKDSSVAYDGSGIKSAVKLKYSIDQFFKCLEKFLALGFPTTSDVQFLKKTFSEIESLPSIDPDFLSALSILHRYDLRERAYAVVKAIKNVQETSEVWKNAMKGIGANPDGFEANLREMAENAKTMFPEGNRFSLNSINEDFGHKSKIFSTIEDHIALSKDFLREGDMEIHDINVGKLLDILDFCELSCHLPSSETSLRSRHSVVSGADLYISVAESAVEKAKDIKLVLSTDFDFDKIDEISVEKLYNIQKDFSKKGIFSLLSLSHKKSSYLYETLRKKSSSFEDITSKIENVKSILHYKEVMHQEVRLDDLRSLLGYKFCGLESDFTAIKSVCRWANSVRTSQAASNFPSGQKVLFFSSSRFMERMRTHFLDNSHLIREFLLKFPRDMLVEDVCAEEAMRLGSLRKLGQELQEIGLSGCTDWSELGFLSLMKSKEMSERQNLESLLEEDAEIGILFESCGRNEVNFEKTADIYSNIRDSKIPAEMKNIILLGSGEELTSLKFLVPFCSHFLKEMENSFTEFFAEFKGPITFDDIFNLNGIKWVSDKLKSALSDVQAASGLVEVLVHAHDIGSGGGGPVLDAYGPETPYSHMGVAYELVVLRSLVASIRRTSPSLSQFSGYMHSKMRDSCSKSDQDIMILKRGNLAWGLWGKAASEGYALSGAADPVSLGVSALKKHLGSKNSPKRKDITVSAGQALLALTPCVVASPSTLAECFPSGAFKFDSLIIDDASGMRDKLAETAVSRAYQIVTLGDSRFSISGNVMDKVSAMGAVNVKLQKSYISSFQGGLEIVNRLFYDGLMSACLSTDSTTPGCDIRFFSDNEEQVKSFDPLEDMVKKAVEITSASDSSVLILMPTELEKEESLRIIGALGLEDDSVFRIIVGVFSEAVPAKSDLSLVYLPQRLMCQKNLAYALTTSESGVTIYTDMSREDFESSDPTFSSFLHILENTQPYWSRSPSDSFQKVVGRVLEENGYECFYGQGGAVFDVQVAVTRPGKRKFIAGIVMDGGLAPEGSFKDSFRSTRQATIAKGWNLYDAWSIDWFEDPLKESEKMIAAIAQFGHQQ